MALDSNHVTKLGELKQLIDGLWSKVTTTISNAVSGLLSKTEAEETYATQEGVSNGFTTLGNEVATKASNDDLMGAYNELNTNKANADGSNASGTWGISISGTAEKSKILFQKSLSSGASDCYGIYLGDLISNTSTAASTATFLVEVSIRASYASMQYLVHIERRGSSEFKFSVTEITARNSGSFADDVTVLLGYKNVRNWSSSSNGLSSWYLCLANATPNVAPKQYVSIKVARLLDDNSLFEEKYELLTSAPDMDSTHQARIMACTYISASKGSSTRPCFISATGLIQPCNYGIAVGSTGTDANTVYFV